MVKEHKSKDKVIRIWTWNVRSPHEEGTLQNLANILRKFDLNNLAFQETMRLEN